MRDPAQDYYSEKLGDRSEKKPQTFQIGWFPNIPLAALLAAVLFYVLGSSYLYGYYTSFGLSVNELGLDAQATMLSGSMVFQGWRLVFIAIILVLAIAVGTLVRARSRHQLIGEVDITKRQVLVEVLVGNRETTRLESEEVVSEGRHSRGGGKPWFPDMKYVGIVGLLLSILCVPLVGAAVGRWDASRDIREETTTLPPAHLVTNSDGSKSMAEVSLPDWKLGYHLLVHGRSGFYLFRPLRYVKGIPPLKDANDKVVVKISLMFISNASVVAGEFTPRVPESIAKEVQP